MYSNSKYNDNLNEYTQDIIDLFYPIGRGFIDFTDTDYSNYLGCTWERELVGLTPIGYDPDDSDFNQLGKTLGEKTHTLTINEIPSHSHNSTSKGFIIDTGATHNYSRGNITAPAVINTSTKTANTGGGKPHNNIQPSKVVAYWKRIA